MMGKVLLLAAGAAGYVLGTRAGRERYEEIKAYANRLWQNPKVQDTASRAEQLAKENAPRAQQKVTEVATKAADVARSKVGRGDQESDTDTQPSSGSGEPLSGATPTTVANSAAGKTTHG